MPLFEVETDAHIIITWAGNEEAARHVLADAYPRDRVIRMTKRPRDTWVISKGALGLTGATAIPATRRAIVSPRPPATRCMPSGCTCMRPARTWNMPAKPSNRTW